MSQATAVTETIIQQTSELPTSLEDVLHRVKPLHTELLRKGARAQIHDSQSSFAGWESAKQDGVGDLGEAASKITFGGKYCEPIIVYENIYGRKKIAPDAVVIDDLFKTFHEVKTISPRSALRIKDHQIAGYKTLVDEGHNAATITLFYKINQNLAKNKKTGKISADNLQEHAAESFKFGLYLDWPITVALYNARSEEFVNRKEESSGKDNDRNTFPAHTSVNNPFLFQMVYDPIKALVDLSFDSYTPTAGQWEQRYQSFSDRFEVSRHMTSPRMRSNGRHIKQFPVVSILDKYWQENRTTGTDLKIESNDHNLLGNGYTAPEVIIPQVYLDKFSVDRTDLVDGDIVDTLFDDMLNEFHYKPAPSKYGKVAASPEIPF